MQQNVAGAMLAVALGIGCAVIAVVLVVAIFYLLTLQKALSRVAPRNRLMEPGMVWLSLIPCFNLFWQFVVANRVPDSLRNEFRDRGQDDRSDYGKTIAMSAAYLSIANVFLNALSNVPSLRTIAGVIALPIGIAILVLFIMFWVKVAGYSNRLAHDSGDFDRRRDEFDDDDDDDDDDDRPRRRRSPPSDSFREGDGGRQR